MKKIIQHAALSIGFFSALCLFSHAAPAAAPSMFSLLPPAEALVDNDLDVRDELNRPVHNTVARRRFQALWSGTLTQLFLSGLTPNKLRLYALLQTSWDRMNYFFGRCVARVFEETFALAPSAFSVLMLSTPLGLRFAVLRSSGRVAVPDGFANDFLALILSCTRILR